MRVFVLCLTICVFLISGVSGVHAGTVNGSLDQLFELELYRDARPGIEPATEIFSDSIDCGHSNASYAIYSFGNFNAEDISIDSCYYAVGTHFRMTTACAFPFEVYAGYYSGCGLTFIVSTDIIGAHEDTLIVEASMEGVGSEIFRYPVHGNRVESLGYFTLDQAGPPEWHYTLHWVSGILCDPVFDNLCDGTTGSSFGDASGWSANYIDQNSIYFHSYDSRLRSGSLGTFVLSHPSCAGPIEFYVGDSTGSIDGPLPVELTSFDAIGGNREVVLNWQTASETDNDRFEIMRDGQLVHIETGSNSATGDRYHWVDSQVDNGTVYNYTLLSVSIDGVRAFLESTEATPRANAATITEYALHQNFPNPFNPDTKITFDLAESGYTKIIVYNSVGQTMATLVNNEMPAGRHSINFNAEALPSGLYFYRMDAGDFTSVKKMILMK